MALEQLSDVVQRCQTVSDDGYSSEDHDVFTIAGRSCIEAGDSAQVLSIVLDEKNQDIVQSMGWNLLPPLVRVLLNKEDQQLPQCVAIFNHLLETCRPKELVIGLLEQLEQDDPEAVAGSLQLLLQPLQTVLLRLGNRKAPSVGITLSSALEQLEKLPLPVTKEQEEDDVFSLCRCCGRLTEFIQPFVEEATNSRKEDELRTELLKFCMKTLSHPLLMVTLRDADTLPTSPLRTFAVQILKTLRSIGEPLPSLVQQPLLRRKHVPGFLEEEVRYPKESLASLAHLVFVHHLAADAFPTVYSPVFCLRGNMEHVTVLLSSTEESKLGKGLELYEKSLVRLTDSSLCAELLEIRSFHTVPQSMVKVMTLCPHLHLRNKALKVFQLSIDKFDTEAKYRFFLFLLKTSAHSGVEGYIIKSIKEQIHAALQPGGSNIWFEGIHLLPLLRKVFTLPEGPETDLLQNLDRIMDSLNLLLYLIIRDKVTENQTGIWTELCKIEDSFLKPLRVGLDMSRAHYEREILNMKENKKNKTQETQAEVCVTVGDETLPHVTEESQIQALNSALYSFDLMKSVLLRIVELIQVSTPA
ncbi:glomulin, FKBP associated protein a [Gouania willdenowi]|uniref:Glomulin, FKBP associated protein a n=1 Tax=Gouania willdenowi TaxID=441366 RepID=A0A8C5E9A0_GOUWI|nr:glomulin [Gouania willdenowi]